MKYRGIFIKGFLFLLLLNSCAYLTGPVPTSENTGLFAPVISWSATKFKNDAPITLTTSESGAEIYYTTDGTEPSVLPALLYTATFPLTPGNHVIKALVFKDGKTSPIKSLTINVGDGTAAYPYQIASAAHLDNIRPPYLVSQFVQVADIDLSSFASGDGWLPIGDTTNVFDGSYDGNGYKIRNLKINRPSMNNLGLFGVLGSTGKVSKVILENIDIIGNAYIGGISGRANTGAQIQYCRASGVITANGGTSGGLVGHLDGTIYGSAAHVQIKAYSDNVGGLVGVTYNTVAEIKESYATGDVEAVGKNHAGGLVGNQMTASKITNCYATGQVTGMDYLGGLTGASNGQITHSYATGLVNSGGAANTGGLVGSFTGPTPALSYYDMNTSGKSDVGKGIPKTTSEMKTAATFSGWDTGVWNIQDGSYPKLSWQ